MTGELLALAAMLMFASNILVTRAASARLDVGVGFVISVVVNLVFAALVFGVESALREPPIRWDAYGLALFALAGAATTYLGRFFFFGAIARLGSARASLFHVSSPAFTAMIAWAVLDEALRLATVVAIAATIAGLLLISVPAGVLRRSPTDAVVRPATSRMHGPRRVLASGLAVGIGATLAYSIGSVLRGMSVRQWNEPVAGALVGAAAALALQLLIGRKNASLPQRLAVADRGALGMYAIGGVLTITAQMCAIASMRHIPVAIASVITLCTPLVVLPFGYWVMNNQERIDARTLAGAALALGGMVVIVLR